MEKHKQIPWNEMGRFGIVGGALEVRIGRSFRGGHIRLGSGRSILDWVVRNLRSNLRLDK